MRAAKLLLAALALGVAFTYGIAVGYQQVWPFALIQDARNVLRGDEPSPQQPRVTIFEVFSPQSDIVMIGDSITESGPWNEIFPGKVIANRGVRGDTARDILSRMDTVLSVNPKQAFVMVGVNDVSQGQSTAEIVENYTGILKKLKDEGVSTVVLSTLECRCPKHIETIRELNSILAKSAQLHGARFIDLNAAMSTPEGIRPELTFDGIHLTGAGYQAVSKAIGPVLIP